MLVHDVRSLEHEEGFTFKIRKKSGGKFTSEEIVEALKVAMKMHHGKNVEVKVNARSSVG